MQYQYNTNTHQSLTQSLSLCQALQPFVKKKQGKASKTDVKLPQIKNHLCVFVNCLIENPAFDSQTKETLTTRSKDFGSKVSEPINLNSVVVCCVPKT